jgi:hypothetical protein
VGGGLVPVQAAPLDSGDHRVPEPGSNQNWTCLFLCIMLNKKVTKLRSTYLITDRMLMSFQWHRLDGVCGGMLEANERYRSEMR